MKKHDKYDDFYSDISEIEQKGARIMVCIMVGALILIPTLFIWIAS